MDTQRILVVDDDLAIRTMLVQILGMSGYCVALARDGIEAIEMVSSQRPDLILTDLDMPRLSGFDLCRQLKLTPETQLIPIVMITGRQAQDAKLKAWEMGADDFLTKPFDTVEVQARCRSLLRLKALLDDLDSAERVMFAFARAVEAKCRYTWGHSERVTNYALELAGRIGLSEDDQRVIKKGGLLHDLGKIHIPDAVLNKPGPLTEEEYAIIKRHPVQGVHIVEPLRSVRDAIPIIRWHHERRDGEGYPDGLADSEIPLTVRVLSVADVFDALSSARPYRPALALSACFDILRTDAEGGGLDVELVRQFCELPTIASNR